MAAKDQGRRERILYLLKTKGERTALALSRTLGISKEGARQHLEALEGDGLVESRPERKPRRGRPAKLFRLTQDGHARFPEGYAELAVDLITTVREELGEEALEAFLAHRMKRTLAGYRAELPDPDAPLSRRVAALARLRAREGYMARSLSGGDGSVLLIEDHCPICAAAELCQGLCRSELDLFRAALGREIRVEREEHLLAGARRCVYRMTPR